MVAQPVGDRSGPAAGRGPASPSEARPSVRDVVP
jgi:hypothetical protein